MGATSSTTRYCLPNPNPPNPNLLDHKALREIGFRVYGIGKPQPQTDAETTSAEAAAWGRKSNPNPNPNPNPRLGSDELP